jgi:hypothetical protein
MSDSICIVLIVLRMLTIRYSCFHLLPIILYVAEKHLYNYFFLGLFRVSQSPVHDSFYRDACHIAQAGDTMS